ncbi:acetyl-CoA carboxylase, carboxyltransferase subunit beta [Limisphaera sp. VF-2]|jgi:acetyl-CoA carboxylase carboxyl transferase subunit beta|uniref:acetyl-CoA carboxylase, carboxyltransferase subunit beta n=1 Tax=Limisphaera sp. VF-2 TaxID=3400418 RepID=UPI001755F3FE|nr:acetyl-CoA carboxylase, carboxyltransferase subunit beta [Limisphaera sp.]
MATTSFTRKPVGPEPKDAVPQASSPNGDPGTTFVRKPKLASKGRKRDIPEGLWTKCPKCQAMVFDKELDENLKVCPKCGHHFQMSARERIHSLVETCTFEEMDADLASVDVLGFTGTASYTAKLEEYQRATGLKDAVVTGLCRIGPHFCGLGVMDFGFLGGSMGSVVGEKLTRLIEVCTDRELPLIIVSSSGGARMYEGLFSLMQMAKTCGALAYHARAGLPFISVLTHPTTAGVMASFATVGDLILAEPGAMIGFAGPRVIKDTTQSELPPGFQTAEFLLEHGLIDAIVPRPQLRSRLITYLNYLTASRRSAPAAA